MIIRVISAQCFECGKLYEMNKMGDERGVNCPVECKTKNIAVIRKGGDEQNEGRTDGQVKKKTKRS